MGYDLHITRKSDWPLRGNDITRDEWLAVVAADPELRLDGYAEAPLPEGKVLRVEDSTLAVWIGWAGHVEGREMAPLYLSNGNIDSKNPDEDTRRKMWRIAQQLNARVQGDDGEFYDEAGNGAYEELGPMRPRESPPFEDEPPKPQPMQTKPASSWLNRLFRLLSRGA
jgi:hypothetical protein